MKYFKFNKFNKMFLVAFIMLITISIILEHWTAIIAGVLGICSTFNTATYTEMYRLKNEESTRRKKIIAFYKQLTGVWN